MGTERERDVLARWSAIEFDQRPDVCSLQFAAEVRALRAERDALRTKLDGGARGHAFLDGDRFCPEPECSTRAASYCFVMACEHDRPEDAVEGERLAVLIFTDEEAQHDDE